MFMLAVPHFIILVAVSEFSLQFSRSVPSVVLKSEIALSIFFLPLLLFVTVELDMDSSTWAKGRIDV